MSSLSILIVPVLLCVCSVERKIRDRERVVRKAWGSNLGRQETTLKKAWNARLKTLPSFTLSQGHHVHTSPSKARLLMPCRNAVWTALFWAQQGLIIALARTFHHAQPQALERDQTSLIDDKPKILIISPTTHLLPGRCAPGLFLCAQLWRLILGLRKSIS